MATGPCPYTLIRSVGVGDVRFLSNLEIFRRPAFITWSGSQLVSTFGPSPQYERVRTYIYRYSDTEGHCE